MSTPDHTGRESGQPLAGDLMSKCLKCGLDVQWAEKAGVAIPLDPDFSDHRESCAGRTHFSREQIRDRNHEERVSRFMAKVRRRQQR